MVLETGWVLASIVGAIVGLFFLLLYFAIIGVVIAGVWKTFTKAGKPGWASLIPIYNVYVLLQIVGRPGWWLIPLMLPFINIIFKTIGSIRR